MCYWNQRGYLAFGPSACGFDGVRRYRYSCSTEEYISENGLVEPVIEETLSESDLSREKTMLSLRLSDGTDSETLEALIADKEKKKFIQFLISGSLAINNEKGGLSLTDRGFLVSNRIISELI